MDYTNLSDIERGKGNPSVRSLLRLALALQIPPSHLLQPLDNRSDLFLSEEITFKFRLQAKFSSMNA
jgi:transcriptional regulator with XRE-family HTH domain